jgi:hypothetical protein
LWCSHFQVEPISHKGEIIDGDEPVGGPMKDMTPKQLDEFEESLKQEAAWEAFVKVFDADPRRSKQYLENRQ